MGTGAQTRARAPRRRSDQPARTAARRGRGRATAEGRRSRRVRHARRAARRCSPCPRGRRNTSVCRGRLPAARPARRGCPRRSRPPARRPGFPSPRTPCRGCARSRSRRTCPAPRRWGQGAESSPPGGGAPSAPARRSPPRVRKPARPGPRAHDVPPPNSDVRATTLQGSSTLNASDPRSLTARRGARAKYARPSLLLGGSSKSAVVPSCDCRLGRRLSGKGVLSDALGSLAGMGARFIGGDREQVFLMPPSVRDWVPEGHLVWTVLGAVAELDLSAFYAAYRVDGHGRPAYEPSMMVALLLYAYAR